MFRPDVVVRALISAGACAAVVGCDVARDSATTDGGDFDAAVPINDDLVPPVGSPSTLDLASWNVEFFPKSDRAITMLADLVTSLELDLVVFEEISSIDAWNQLVARLPDHGGVLSSHRYSPTDYQKIGFLYREGLVTLGPEELLFTSDSTRFPRPPMKAHVDVAGLSFDLIGVHLKAGVDLADIERRAASIQSLETYVRAQIEAGGEDEVILLGDYNEVLSNDSGRQVLAPLYGAPDKYRFLTESVSDVGEYSFTPAKVILDHIVVTAGWFDEVGAADAQILPFDRELATYTTELSDHLPVVLSVPLP